MRRIAVAAAALTAAGALTGAAALPGAVASGSEAPEAKLQTLRLSLHETASRGVGNYTFAGTDVDRHGGDVVGFDSYTGRFYPKQNKVVIQVAFALSNGIIVGRVSAQGDSNQYQGLVTKGTGKYLGVRGTISGHAVAGHPKGTVLVLRYHH
jgi:hypothetical protein